MENTTQALEARIAALEKHLGISNEPKDGEWYETNFEGTKWIFKFKSIKNKEVGHIFYHISIESNGLLDTNDWCHSFEKARKITPEEALPYIEKCLDKMGIKKGSKVKSFLDGFEYIVKNELNISPLFDVGDGYVTLFRNDTNTFATLVEEKVKPLEVGNFIVKVLDNKEITITHNSKVTFCFEHSQIEAIHQYSLKAQGK